MKLKYTISGADVDKVGYELSGEVEGDSPIDPHAFALAARLAFHQLTGGKAVYGQAGKTCRGPYTVKRLVLEAQFDG